MLYRVMPLVAMFCLGMAASQNCEDLLVAKLELVSEDAQAAKGESAELGKFRRISVQELLRLVAQPGSRAVASEFEWRGREAHFALVPSSENSVAEIALEAEVPEVFLKEEILSRIRFPVLAGENDYQIHVYLNGDILLASVKGLMFQGEPSLQQAFAWGLPFKVPSPSLLSTTAFVNVRSLEQTVIDYGRPKIPYRLSFRRISIQSARETASQPGFESVDSEFEYQGRRMKLTRSKAALAVEAESLAGSGEYELLGTVALPQHQEIDDIHVQVETDGRKLVITLGALFTQGEAGWQQAFVASVVPRPPVR